MAKMKTLSVHELKHDVQYMNMAQELREAAAEGDKKAKKFMKLKMKHETKYEEGVRKEEEDILRIQQINDGVDLNIATAKPSLYHVVNFLTNHFVRFLPAARCLGCGKALVCELKESIKTDEMRPERSYCAHWMHFKCFDSYVNEPPFLRPCPADGCGADFGSPNFKVDPQTVKSREKVYMQAEQKAGEEDDLDRLLGL